MLIIRVRVNRKFLYEFWKPRFLGLSRGCRSDMKMISLVLYMYDSFKTRFVSFQFSEMHTCSHRQLLLSNKNVPCPINNFWSTCIYIIQEFPQETKRRITQLFFNIIFFVNYQVNLQRIFEINRSIWNKWKNKNAIFHYNLHYDASIIFMSGSTFTKHSKLSRFQ